MFKVNACKKKLLPSILFSFLQFKHHASSHYHLLCRLLGLELKYEVRSLLRQVFMRIGQEFGIVGQHDTTR